MSELTNHLQDVCSEIDLLEEQILEFQGGVKQQVESILSRPPPRSLYKKSSPTGSSHAPLNIVPPLVPSHGSSKQFMTTPPSVPRHQSQRPSPPVVPDRRGGSSLPTTPMPPPRVYPIHQRPLPPMPTTSTGPTPMSHRMPPSHATGLNPPLIPVHKSDSSLDTMISTNPPPRVPPHLQQPLTHESVSSLPILPISTDASFDPLSSVQTKNPSWPTNEQVSTRDTPPAPPPRKGSPESPLPLIQFD